MWKYSLGPLRKDIGVEGGSEIAIFPYFMYWTCPYVGRWMVKKTKTALRNMKMVQSCA